MVEWIFIATDSSYIGKEYDKMTNMFKRMECVKTKNIPKDDIGNYQPLCLFYKIGSKDMMGRVVKKITHESDRYTVTGVLMKGRPLPFSVSFTNGESFSFPFIYESGTENKATPIVTNMMNTMDELENYVKSLQQLYGKELKVAETNESFNAEGSDNYENHLVLLGEGHNLENNPQPKWLEGFNAEHYIGANWRSEFLKQSEFEKGYWEKLRAAISQ
tara:strand:+ start:1851 stop:2501 length:651 start_codon:yes stop_codon:yes gene_type:complete